MAGLRCSQSGVFLSELRRGRALVLRHQPPLALDLALGFVDQGAVKAGDDLGVLQLSWLVAS